MVAAVELVKGDEELNESDRHYVSSHGCALSIAVLPSLLLQEICFVPPIAFLASLTGHSDPRIAAGVVYLLVHLLLPFLVLLRSKLEVGWFSLLLLLSFDIVVVVVIVVSVVTILLFSLLLL